MSKYEEWVDRLLGQDELPKRTDTQLERNIGSRPIWYPALWIGLGVLSIALVFWADTTGWRAVGGWVLGLVCIFLGFKSAQIQSSYHQSKALQNEDDVRFAREVYLKRMDYQPVNLSTLTNGDIERMRAEGTLHALNLAQLQNERHVQLTHEETERVREHEAAMAAAGYRFTTEEAIRQREHEEREAKRQREHEAREAEKNRRLDLTKSREQIKADFKKQKVRLEKELEILRERLKTDNPSEVERIYDKVSAFDLEMATRRTIEAMPDSDEKWRAMEAWERRVAGL